MKIQTRTIAFTALMTALVTISTAFLGVNMGTTYTNLGDTMIFVTAALFGPVPAMIAGGLGSFIADMMVFPMTMWFTLVIKGIEGLICGFLIRIFSKLNFKKPIGIILNFIAMIAAGIWMMAGYFLAESLLYGTLAAAVFALSANAVQATLSITCALILVYGFKLCKMSIDLKVFKSTHSKSTKTNSRDTSTETPPTIE
ncbi:MAG: ECF transporter S component [Clostridia bacterium]|nr:ECF transporter S component [Clostridia bacterium]